MLDIFNEISAWHAAGKDFALATVTRTWGSSPRRAGSSMIISRDLEVAGSVSGGCIEGAVIEAAQETLQSGISQWLSFGVEDESAWSVGLTCGGKVEVLVQRFPGSTSPEVWQTLVAAHTNNQPGVLVTYTLEGQTKHTFVDANGALTGSSISDDEVDACMEAYNARESRPLDLASGKGFAHVLPRKDQLLIVGAAHIAVSLVRQARLFGFEITVIDPRGVFAAENRFPVPPDHLHISWPQEVFPELDLHEDTYAVLLTHDPKIDDPATHALLKSKVKYIGALGSKKTQQKRRDRLTHAGFSDEDIARIHGPIGLPIGAATPDEIALSVMAEIIQVKRTSPPRRR